MGSCAAAMSKRWGMEANISWTSRKKHRVCEGQQAAITTQRPRAYPCQRRHLSHPSGKRREGFQRTIPQKERKNIFPPENKGTRAQWGFQWEILNLKWNPTFLFWWRQGQERAKNRITKTNFIWNIQWKKYWIRTNVNNKKMRNFKPKWGFNDHFVLKKELNPFSNFLAYKKETSMWTIQFQNYSKSF